MNWWEAINPLSGLSGTVVGKAAADGFTVVMVALWNCGLMVLKWVLLLEDQFLDPDLGTDGRLSGIYQVTFWIAGVLALVLLMVQLGVTMIRRDGQSLARVFLGGGQFVMVWAAWVAYAVAVRKAAGGLTRSLMQALLNVDTFSAWEPWAPLSVGDISEVATATVLGVLGVFVIFAAIGHLLILLARGVALLVLSATAPIAAAGLMWEGGRAWFWKAFRWFHAAAFTPVLVVIVMGAGVKVTTAVALSGGDSLEEAVGTALPGVLLLVVSCFAPLALFKLLAFVDPGTSSGAAMRAGAAAQGGIWGLLGAGGAGGGGATSAAASTASADGSSQGEQSAQDGVTGKLGKAMGALGAAGTAYSTGLGGVLAASNAATVIGADTTNQMGVGHNTYIPDFGGKGRNQGGPSARNNPAINGADGADNNGLGQAGTGGTSTPVPSPPNLGGAEPSSVGPTPASPAEAGGVGAAGGAGATGAAGGAAAVPIVPA